MAPPIALEPAVPPGVALLGSTRPAFPVELARGAVNAASGADAFEAHRARGDQLWGFLDGPRLVCHGWVGLLGRTIGLRRCRDRAGRAFLFDFQARDGADRARLLASLAEQIRYHLGQDGYDQLLMDIAADDPALLAALSHAGFLPVARTAVRTLLSRFRYEPPGSTVEYPRPAIRALWTGGAVTIETVDRVAPGTAATPVARADGSDLAVAILEDERAWDAIRTEWEQLHGESQSASPPLSWDWLRTWWSIYGATYGHGPRALRIVTMRRDGRLVGALPLYQLRLAENPLSPIRLSPIRLSPIRLSPIRLSMISTGEGEFEETCPDYLDLLHRAGEGEACAAALARVLFTEPRVPWDWLQLDDAPITSPLWSLVERAPAGVSISRTDRGTCPTADLRGGIEAFIARLPSRRRTQPRRLLRQIAESGARLETAGDAEQADAFFDEMVLLHAARWNAVGKPGAFSSPRFVQFHRALIRAWASAGRAVLARLTLQGKTLAVVYGFVSRGKFDFYQMGTMLEGSTAFASPGLAAHLGLMRHLSGRGIDTYDFLREDLVPGASSYKQRLATGETEMMRLCFEREGLRRDVDHAIDSGRELARRALRLARRRLEGWSERAGAPDPAGPGA